MKILLAGRNTANLLHSFRLGLQNLGHSVRALNYSPDASPFYPMVSFAENYSFDCFSRKRSGFFRLFNKSRYQPRREFFNLVEDVDLIIFNSCTTLMPGLLDLPLLQKMGKKVIVRQTGSDMRALYPGGIFWNHCGCSYNISKEGLESLSRQKKQYRSPRHFHNIIYREQLAPKLYLTAMASLYAMVLTGGPDSTSLVTRPFHAGINTYDAAGTKAHIPNNRVPVVVHAPSNSIKKGSALILETLNRLEREGVPFKLITPEKLPNDKLKELLSEADIVIDAVFCGGHGILANESMASGCVVIGANDPVVQPLPRNRPVVPIRKDTMYEQIKRILLDAINAGFTHWNFGGTGFDQQSLFHFKEGWGAKEYPYKLAIYCNKQRLNKLDLQTVLKEFSYYYIYPLRQLT